MQYFQRSPSPLFCSTNEQGIVFHFIRGKGTLPFLDYSWTIFEDFQRQFRSQLLYFMNDPVLMMVSLSALDNFLIEASALSAAEREPIFC